MHQQVRARPVIPTFEVILVVDIEATTEVSEDAAEAEAGGTIAVIEVESLIATSEIGETIEVRHHNFGMIEAETVGVDENHTEAAEHLLPKAEVGRQITVHAIAGMRHPILRSIVRAEALEMDRYRAAHLVQTRFLLSVVDMAELLEADVDEDGAATTTMDSIDQLAEVGLLSLLIVGLNLQQHHLLKFQHLDRPLQHPCLPLYQIPPPWTLLGPLQV